MTPERRAAETAMKILTGEQLFLKEILRKDMERHRQLHLGYTIEEERLWRLFNRCCHPGRKIRLLPRVMRMAVTKPNQIVVRRRTFTDEQAREIIRMSQ